MIDRRSLLLALPALTLVPRRSRAAPSPQERKLANRIELWSSYAKRTRNLMTRLSTRRETSLLEQPLMSTGTLVYLAPQLLVLRDDGRQGSTTLIDGDRIRLFLNSQDRHHAAATVADQRPAAQWLAARLRLMFTPDDGTGSALLEDTRTNVPKGHGHRLELMPPRGSAARRQLRSVSMQLDPVTGTIVQIVVAEAQGDRVVMGLSDHRQNLPDGDIESFLEPLDG